MGPSSPAEDGGNNDDDDDDDDDDDNNNNNNKSRNNTTTNNNHTCALLACFGAYSLRNENAQLRLDLGAMESDTALLKANMAQAGERIEALMQRLP